MSDADVGGFSDRSLDFVPSSKTEPSHALFRGNISLDLPADKPKLLISGYAGFRTEDRKANLFGRGYWNVDPYSFLALRVKSDGRKYFVNIQTDSIEPTDLHQHRLYTKNPGKWEIVLININDFVRTNDGRIVDPQSDMIRERVNSVGISLTDRIPGPFELRVERIWATNGLALEQLTDPEEHGILTNDSGEITSQKKVT
jgi:NADH dehydrogenase [ubiquinone] 1 alpha subcomplex assembly factor 1